MIWDLSISNEEGVIYIFDEPVNREDPFYYIPKDRALEKRGGLDFECSDWIAHIGRKSWAAPHLLFEIARIINNENPKNDIDWQKSFEYLIECSSRTEITDMSTTLLQDLEKNGLM